MELIQFCHQQKEPPTSSAQWSLYETQSPARLFSESQWKGRREVLSLLHPALSEGASRAAHSSDHKHLSSGYYRHTDPLYTVIEVIRRFITSCTRQEASLLHFCLSSPCSDWDTCVCLLLDFTGLNTWDRSGAVINGTLVSSRLTFLG